MECVQRRFTPPLVLAVRGNRSDMVQTLLTHGADPNLGYHGLPNGGGRVQGAMFCEGGNGDEDLAAPRTAGHGARARRHGAVPHRRRCRRRAPPSRLARRPAAARAGPSLRDGAA